MDSERWTRVKQLVDQALAREPSARETFLADACAGDADLRAEVESLLRQENGSLFETRDAPAHPLVGRRLGSYEILSAIGAGGMGEVYRARDLKLGREVAIKVLPEDLASDPDRLRRFEREARTASSLNHPNIVTIHDIDEQDGIHYIAMELVEGTTLRELLRGDRSRRPACSRSRGRRQTDCPGLTRRVSCTGISSPRTSSSATTGC